MIHDATIEGRVELDNVALPDGGPVGAIEFRECVFNGGFSGAHGHFRRLLFSDCRFREPRPPARKPSPGAGVQGKAKARVRPRPQPSIDLYGATICSDLDLQGIRPEGDGLEGAAADLDYLREGPERAEAHCWVGLGGARVDGKVDLSRARLRAPPDPRDRLLSEPGINALDLSLAVVNGDIQLLSGSRARGRIMARGVHIKGDLWLSGAKLNGIDRHALVLQLATIDGVLVLDSRPDDIGRRGKVRMFVSRGMLNLLDLRLGGSLMIGDASLSGTMAEADGERGPCLYLMGTRISGNFTVSQSMFDGDLIAAPLRCSGDAALDARVRGSVDLEGAGIGGSLDISNLKIEGDTNRLSLKDANIGRALRLVPPAGSAGRFELAGAADLGGLTCDTLDDEVGRRWGSEPRIEMNHFTYRQTGWLPEENPELGRQKKSSNRIVGDWLLGKKAEGRLPWVAIGRALLPKTDDFWEPWQLRRNWIYQQFDVKGENLASISRHRIDDREYRPQPFEQAIRVARAEGREDFATHFEMLKQNIEWRLFNRRARWGLAVVAITLSSLWLIVKHSSASSIVWTAVALAFTITFMINASRIFDAFRGERPEEGQPETKAYKRREVIAKGATWIVFFLPAALLYFHAGWNHEPFYFLISSLIFLAIRLLSVFAHAVMRFGFGYLRRPVYAISTLIFAFLLGWLGVHVANTNQMLVVDAEPVASLVSTEASGESANGAAAVRPLFMGSENAGKGVRFIRDVSCGALISEPLYALDVLIPLLDLREESRCEVRRHARDLAMEPPGAATMRGLWGVLAALPRLTVDNHGFWAVLKALYAIAGWFIVSLSILTFAQANRTHAEPPTEHR